MITKPTAEITITRTTVSITARGNLDERKAQAAVAQAMRAPDLASAMQALWDAGLDIVHR